MKTRKRKQSGGDALPSAVDFRGGVRGKYASRYAAGTNVVLLEPDVAKAFRGDAAVNSALRKLMGAGHRRRRSES